VKTLSVTEKLTYI